MQDANCWEQFKYTRVGRLVWLQKLDDRWWNTMAEPWINARTTMEKEQKSDETFRHMECIERRIRTLFEEIENTAPPARGWTGGLNCSMLQELEKLLDYAEKMCNKYRK